MSRVDVRKTHKLFIGGAFPRSESGRTYEVINAKGEFIANVAQASRKDARDAVLAARSAFVKWSSATAYNRGQVLYRIAEVMEGRREQFIHEVEQGEDLSTRKATSQVDAAIDRWVWYAGWADKYAQAIGNTNPVAGPFFNFSVPEPTGVVAAVAPQDNTVLGLTSVVAPIIMTGNAVIIMPSPSAPIPAGNWPKDCWPTSPRKEPSSPTTRSSRKVSSANSPTPSRISPLPFWPSTTGSAT